MNRRLHTLALGSLLAVSAVACGGEYDEEDLAAWCEQMAAIDDREGLPTDEEFDALVDTAPDEIVDDVEAAVAILQEHGEEAVGSPQLEPHLDAVFGFRVDRCTAG